MNDSIPVLEAQINSLEGEIAQKRKQVDALREAGVKSSLKITYSLDRSVYYISDSFNMPRAWFGTNKITEQPKENGIFMGGYVETTLKDGTKYWRSYYPFNFWSIKSGERGVATTLDDDLAKDYVSFGIQAWQWKGYES